MPLCGKQRAALGASHGAGASAPDASVPVEPVCLRMQDRTVLVYGLNEGCCRCPTAPPQSTGHLLWVLVENSAITGGGGCGDASLFGPNTVHFHTTKHQHKTWKRFCGTSSLLMARLQVLCELALLGMESDSFPFPPAVTCSISLRSCYGPIWSFDQGYLIFLQAYSPLTPQTARSKS